MVVEYFLDYVALHHHKQIGILIPCMNSPFHRSKNMKTRVIGCPKTIDGDLKCKEVPISFGFDTACKVLHHCALLHYSANPKSVF
jgi:6-phosphofructokinase